MKSELERRFDDLGDKYYEMFGENYPLCIVGQISLKEICDDIENCLKSGKKKPPLEYEDGVDY